MFTRPTIFPVLAALSLALITQGVQAAPIKWRSHLDAALVEAGRTNKLVLVHFYTNSCAPCKKLERDVFSQPQIAVAMEQYYVPVKLNADESPAMANAFQITRVPTEVVLTSQRNIVQKLSCPLVPDAYGAQLVNVAQHYRQNLGMQKTSTQAPVNSAYAGLKIGQANSAQAAPKSPPTNYPPVAPAVMQNPYTAFSPPAAPQRPSVATPNTQSTPGITQNRYAAQMQPPINPQATTTAPVAAAPAIANSAAGSAANSFNPQAQQQLTTAQPKPADSWPPQLPAGAPKLAFEGHCPVSLRQAKKWVRGKQAFGAIHRGCTYLFASEAQRQQFLANPDAYSPVFSGNDPVKMLDENQEVAGHREYGFEYRNAFYLFSSKETMERFAKQPDLYSMGVRQAMNRMDATADGTIRR